MNDIYMQKHIINDMFLHINFIVKLYHVLSNTESKFPTSADHYLEMDTTESSSFGRGSTQP